MVAIVVVDLWCGRVVADAKVTESGQKWKPVFGPRQGCGKFTSHAWTSQRECNLEFSVVVQQPHTSMGVG